MSSLTRQTSAADAATMVTGFSHLQRGLSSRSMPPPASALAERRESAGFAEEEEKDHWPSPEGEAVTEPEVTFPDGGLRVSIQSVYELISRQAWLVVAGAFWTVFCGFGITAGVGAFQTLYRSTFLAEYSESQISWITS